MDTDLRLTEAMHLSLGCGEAFAVAIAVNKRYFLLHCTAAHSVLQSVRPRAGSPGDQLLRTVYPQVVRADWNVARVLRRTGVVRMIDPDNITINAGTRFSLASKYWLVWQHSPTAVLSSCDRTSDSTLRFIASFDPHAASFWGPRDVPIACAVCSDLAHGGLRSAR